MVKKYLGLVGISLMSFLAFLDVTIVNTALPAIQKDLNAPVLQLQWVINSFCLMLCMMMIIGGKMGDVWGHRRIYYVGALFFMLGSLGCGFSTSIDWLIACRVIQGIGGAIFFTVSIALIGELFPNKGQTRAFGIYSALTGFGLAIGPALGGTVVQFASWHWIFFINLPIGILGLMLCLPIIKKSPLLNESIDILGALYLIVFCFFILYGIIKSAELGWHLLTYSYIAIALIALLLLIIRQCRHHQPLLANDVYLDARLRLPILVCIAASFVSCVLMFFSPLYLSHVLAKNGLTIGLMLVAMPAMQIVLSIFIEPLDRIFGIYNLCLVAIFCALFATCLESFFGLHTSLGFILPAFLMMGITWGIGNTSTSLITNRLLPSEKIGVATGTIFTHWNLFGVILLAGASSIFHQSQQHYTQTNVPNAAHHLANPKARLEAIHHASTHSPSHIYNMKMMFLSGFHAILFWGIVILSIVFLITLITRFSIKKTAKPS